MSKITDTVEMMKQQDGLVSGLGHDEDITLVVEKPRIGMLLTRKKILWIIFTGLFTRPVQPDGRPETQRSEDCGMLVTVEDLAMRYTQYDHVFACFSHSGGRDPADQAKTVLARIELEKADEIIVLAHSFGNSFLVFFLWWIIRWIAPSGRPSFSWVFGLDPCKEPIRFGYMKWSIPSIVKRWKTWFQRNGLPWGVKGGGFVDPEGGHNKDVSGTPNVEYGVTLAHVDTGEAIGIPGSAQIRDEISLCLKETLGEPAY